MYDQIPHDMTSDQSLWDTKSRKLVAHFQCFSLVSGSDRDNLAFVVMTCLRPTLNRSNISSLRTTVCWQPFCYELYFFPYWQILYHLPIDSSVYILKTAAQIGLIPGNLFIGRMILRPALSLASGRLERDTVGICSLKIIIMMTAGDVFFNPIKTSPKQRSSVLGELSHGPLGFQFRLDGLQAPEFSYENNVREVHKIKYIYR